MFTPTEYTRMTTEEGVQIVYANPGEDYKTKLLAQLDRIFVVARNYGSSVFLQLKQNVLGTESGKEEQVHGLIGQYCELGYAAEPDDSQTDTIEHLDHILGMHLAQKQYFDFPAGECVLHALNNRLRLEHKNDAGLLAIGCVYNHDFDFTSVTYYYQNGYPHACLTQPDRDLRNWFTLVGNSDLIAGLGGYNKETQTLTFKLHTLELKFVREVSFIVPDITVLDRLCHLSAFGAAYSLLGQNYLAFDTSVPLPGQVSANYQIDGDTIAITQNTLIEQYLKADKDDVEKDSTPWVFLPAALYREDVSRYVIAID